MYFCNMIMFLFCQEVFRKYTQRYLYILILGTCTSSAIERKHMTALHCGHNMTALIRWWVTPIRNCVASLIYRILVKYFWAHIIFAYENDSFSIVIDRLYTELLFVCDICSRRAPGLNFRSAQLFQIIYWKIQSNTVYEQLYANIHSINLDDQQIKKQRMRYPLHKRMYLFIFLVFDCI